MELEDELSELVASAELFIDRSSLLGIELQPDHVIWMNRYVENPISLCLCRVDLYICIGVFM